MNNTTNNQNTTCDAVLKNGTKCKNPSKYGTKCGVHFKQSTLVKCYFNDDGDACGKECKKGQIYCPLHQTSKEMCGFCWNIENFNECKPSLDFHQALAPYVYNVVEVGNTKTCYKLDYPIKKRHRDPTYTEEEKLKNVMMEQTEVKVAFEKYIKYVKTAYPVEYMREGEQLISMRKDIMEELDFEKCIKHIQFNAFSPDGINEQMKLCIYQPRGVNNIIEHIIKERYNGDENNYNIALHLEGEENKIEKWGDEMNDKNIFILTSHTNARPYRVSNASYMVGDRIKYRYDDLNEVCYGIIRAINGDYFGVDGVKFTISKNKKQRKIEWGKHWGGLGRTFNVGWKIIECGRWVDDPIYTSTTGEWMDNIK